VAKRRSLRTSKHWIRVWTARARGPASGHVAQDFLREAMVLFERAERLRPPGNDDALLRYNTCVRILERHPHVVQAPRDHGEPPLE
jgi:hypothetical protein